MAAGATVHTFDIDLADADRSVYETSTLRVARHPSESEEFLLTRVPAYALEFDPGIEFSPGGLSDSDEPAITVRDLTIPMTITSGYILLSLLVSSVVGLVAGIYPAWRASRLHPVVALTRTA